MGLSWNASDTKSLIRCRRRHRVRAVPLVSRLRFIQRHSIRAVRSVLICWPRLLLTRWSMNASSRHEETRQLSFTQPGQQRTSTPIGRLRAGTAGGTTPLGKGHGGTQLRWTARLAPKVLGLVPRRVVLNSTASFSCGGVPAYTSEDIRSWSTVKVSWLPLASKLFHKGQGGAYQVRLSLVRRASASGEESNDKRHSLHWAAPLDLAVVWRAEYP